MSFKLGSFGLLLIAVSNLVQASGTVDFLEVDNDVVLFSTTATKTLTSPSCVATESNELWSVSLASHSGRAIYSLILTSMSSGAALNIESASDCADMGGVERASKVNLMVEGEPNSSNSSGSVGVYKFDGETRLGTLVEYGNPSKFTYADDELSIELKEVDQDFSTITVLYYLEAACSGQAYTTSNKSNALLYNKLYDGGRFYLTESTEQSRNYSSYLNIEYDSCVTRDATGGLRELTIAEHPVCGAGPCKFKQD